MDRSIGFGILLAPFQSGASMEDPVVMEGPIPSSGRLGGLRILVVDDEESTRNALSALLRIFGAADVAVAASAPEAIHTLVSRHPDVLISDIGMPVLDGYALIQKIRKLPAESGGQTPAIALTAFTEPEDVSRAITAGFDAHLPKPVNLRQLFSLITKLGCSRSLARQMAGSQNYSRHQSTRHFCQL